MFIQGSAAVVQVFGCLCSHRDSTLQTGKRIIKVSGCPLEMTKPHTLQYKLLVPVLLLCKEQFVGVDIQVCVKGGSCETQIYAI